MVSISGDKAMASGWQRVERDRLEPPAEAIAIERSGTIRVAHDQVGPTRVRDQTEGHGVEHLTGGEREVPRAVVEDARPALAQEHRPRAEQDEVQVIVVVVVEPHRSREPTLRERGPHPLEAPPTVPEEGRPVPGHDAEVGKAIVVEVPDGNGHHVTKLAESRARNLGGAMAEQPDARA